MCLISLRIIDSGRGKKRGELFLHIRSTQIWAKNCKKLPWLQIVKLGSCWNTSSKYWVKSRVEEMLITSNWRFQIILPCNDLIIHIIDFKLIGHRLISHRPNQLLILFENQYQKWIIVIKNTLTLAKLSNKWPLYDSDCFWGHSNWTNSARWVLNQPYQSFLQMIKHNIGIGVGRERPRVLETCHITELKLI